MTPILILIVLVHVIVINGLSLFFLRVETLFNFQGVKCEVSAFFFMLSRVYTNISSVIYILERYLAISNPLRFQIVNNNIKMVCLVCIFFIFISYITYIHLIIFRVFLYLSVISAEHGKSLYEKTCISRHQFNYNNKFIYMKI